MLKYYQVFISSVSKDFAEIRNEIITKMLKQNKFFPIAMEFMISESSTFDMLYNYIKSSDMCVLLLGDKIGSKLGKAKENITNTDVLKALYVYKEKQGLEDIGEMTYTEVEYALAQHLGIAVIPFVKDSVVNACENNSKNNDLFRFYSAVRAKSGYTTYTDKPASDEIVTALNRHIDTHPDLSGWIKEKDSAIFKSTINAGIIDVYLDGFLSREKLKCWLYDAKELKLCYTTGRAFVLTNSDLLAEFISKGGVIKLLCCKPESKSMYDIQRIEEKVYGSRKQIHKEFFDVYNEFKNIYNIARLNANNEKETLGKIQIGFLSTLLRSSFLICDSNSEHNQKGWFTITLPPAKSRETVSFEIVATEKSPLKNNLLNRCSTYFEYAWNYAIENNEIISIDNTTKITFDNTKADTPDYSYWYKKDEIAKANIKKRKRKKNILIEVAAQHPLKDGLYPAKEFSDRLDYAIKLYEKYIGLGFGVKIFVPGSVHLDFDGVADEVSLSKAGCTYLEDNGIPQESILGEEYNSLYDEQRNHKGVYNTADECYIASKIFFDEKNDFCKLFSVCSPNQLMKKTLFYTEFGIMPYVFTVPTTNMYHNFFHELLVSVPYILNEDSDYQGENSKEAIRTRCERLPGYDENQTN